LRLKRVIDSFPFPVQTGFSGRMREGDHTRVGSEPDFRMLG
jgi:hypothetical protein